MTSVAARMNHFFSTNSIPMDLQADDITDELPKRRAFSRVRKLSKRLSSTFKSSFSLRDATEDTPVASIDRNLTQKKKGPKTGLGRVLSLQTFHESEVFKDKTGTEQTGKMQNHRTFSTMNLSTEHRHDNLRRVLSVPDSAEMRSSSPYGKLEYYTKLEQLGEGSYATVYKGVSKINNILVALKEIRLQEDEGIPFTAIREASLLKDLKHANIVRLHDIIPAKEHLVLVFEYLHTDLCMFLEERPFGLHAQNAKLLLFQLFRGLCYIHQKKILHRDIKPQNILLSNRGELKLADFGLARAKSVPSQTYTNEIVTLWYRPPDVLLGSTHYTTSLDMWGVGCIFVEMISGFPLFPGVKSAQDQLNKIFKVTGTPTVEEWPHVNNISYTRDDFVKYPKQKLSNQVPRLRTIQYASDIADKMLQIEPTNRISASDALHDKYFIDLPKSIYTLPAVTSIFTIPGIKMADDHKRPDTGRPRSNQSNHGHYV